VFTLCQAEETFGKKTPWDSLTKLESVVKRAKETTRDVPDSRKILFQLQAVTWYCASGTVLPTELSLHTLVGKGRGHRGLLDIILFKMDILKDWLTVQIDACQLSTRCKSTIRTSMSDFAAYQQSNEDCTWRAPLLPSGQKFADLLEAGIK
jgi:hypothetical protein